MDEKTISEFNKQVMEDTQNDFKSFEDALQKNLCDICGKKLTYLNRSETCLHWLLKPEGVDKKDIVSVLNEFQFSRIQAYVRWVANCDVPFRNINDLVEEGKSEKLIEETIRYKNIEWSFSCAKTDFEGHNNRYQGSKPHYHFQMRVGGRSFFNYNERHINFYPEDILMIRVKIGEFPQFGFHSLQGMGMQGMMDLMTPEELLQSMGNTDDYENATFRTQSLIIAKEGETFSGDDLIKLFDESKEKNVPTASLLHKLENIDPEKTQIFITPGDGVPEKAIRTQRNRGKNKS